MSCIHYKFKSSLDYNSVTFDGLHLSLADLKKAISQQKRMKPGEFDLEITNAQTGDVYKKNDELIAKNTSVIVSRVPVNKTTASSTQKSWEAFKQECAKVKEKEKQMTLEKLKQAADLAHPPASEIDKIKAVIDLSTKGFEPSSFAGKYQSGVPPDNYVCKRCGQKGHFVSNCPNTNPEDRYVEPRYKRTTGIPSTMLTIVDDPLHPGALLTHHGQFAVPTVDVLGYREVKKERPPFLPHEKEREPEKKKKIPQELLCHICEDLCVDAAIAPCCGTSFCDECLREVLLESDDHMCPSCKETNVSPDKIVPNRSMRIAVTNFLNDTGYTKAKKRRSSSQNGDSLAQAPAILNKQSSPVNPPFQTTTNTSSSADVSPAYTEQNVLSQPHVPVMSVPIRTYAPRPNIVQVQRAQSQYSYTRPPRFTPYQYSKPWRYTSGPSAGEGNAITTISRRIDEDGLSTRAHVDEPPPASYIEPTGFNQPTSMLDIGRSPPGEPAAPGTTPILNRTSLEKLVPPVSQPSWPVATPSLLQTSSIPQLRTSVPPLPLGALMGTKLPVSIVPPQRQIHPGLPPFLPGYPGHQPVVPLIPPTVTAPGAPLSREQFYQAKKMFQTTGVPEKKPVDVFESFADFTRRRSRSSERRRSYSRSRSGSWSKRSSRTPSLSPGKHHSRSLSPRRFSSRSRSRSRQRSLNRSRSKSGLRSQNRSRSRSGPRPVNRSRSRSFDSPRHNSQARSPKRLSKSRSRSRSGQRQSKALSPRQRSPLTPPRRSPLLRSRSRSYGRLSRSRSKSWARRARSNSYSRPTSPRPLSRSPRRSPKRSPYRSPPRKRSFSPRRRSQSFSPYRRSPLRSRSRTPFKRKISRSKTRSPAKRRSFSPQLSPHRPKSPYRKPLSPAPFKRHSPSPFRGRGGYRGRGRGGYGYRDNRDKYRSYPSPPRSLASAGPNIPLSTGNLPPVPYFPQMGLPPPEEYFKYNPDGYQEFVRSFYAQFGPQAQAWAQNQTFSLPVNDRFTSNSIAPNSIGINQRPPLEPVPLSPSQRPRSLTPPGGCGLPRDRKDQPYNKDRDNYIPRHWERDRDKPDRERDRQRDRRPDRGRGFDRYRGRDVDRGERIREDDRYRARDSHRDRERSSERRRSPPKRSKDDEKFKDKDKKKYEKKKGEEKKIKKPEPEARKENADLKDSIIAKTSPISDKDLESPKTEQKPPMHEPPNPEKEAPAKQQVSGTAKTSETEAPLIPQSDAQNSKPAIKEKKAVSKKKGDGLGGKKKVKDTSTEDGGEKKVKKTKKKKLTFGASDVDTKQGLKKKKLKRLVDYKSENCTSEDGEERISLGGSPQKKAKLGEMAQTKDEVIDAVKHEKGDHFQVSSSEPTNEIKTEVKSPQEVNKPVKQETEIVVPEPSGKSSEENGKDKLMPDLPELSKWERDEDFDYFETIDRAREKPQEKTMLPRSVVDKAEKFLTHKPMKNAVMVAHVTTSTRSPDPAHEKRTTERDSPSPESKSSRRVFIEHKGDSKEKKQTDLHITVKTDRRKDYADKRGSTAQKSEDHHRHHYHHHEHDGYEEDQRSVIKSRSLERELQDSKRVPKDRDGYSRKDRSSRGSVTESNQKQESSKRDKNESSKEKGHDKSPEPRERKQYRENEATDASKSKDLRHKLEEKNKAKSTVDNRKLSVMDESEFVPDYEDLGPEGSNENEHDDAATSRNSGASSPDTPEHKHRKKNKGDQEGKGEGKPDSDAASKSKKKKKHKHKEKKEKHKHKKKKHKNKKDKGKEGKQKANKDGNDST